MCLTWLAPAIFRFMVTFKLCSFKFNFFAFYSAFCCFFSSATFDSIVTSVSRKFLFPIPSKYNAENGKHVLQISVSARGNRVMKSSTFTSVTREHTSESGAYTKQSTDLASNNILGKLLWFQLLWLGRSHSSSSGSNTRKMPYALSSVICTPGTWQTLIIRQLPLYDNVFQYTSPLIAISAHRDLCSLHL